MFERILIPLDAIRTSEISLPYAEELATKFGSELILYHVQGHNQVITRLV
jgi:nucleotide-binding universal stress UspA family protein